MVDWKLSDMGDKFDRLVGNFKVKINEKEYPFSMTLRQRGFYNNLRMKMDSEGMMLFLFERFKDGWLNAEKIAGRDANVGQLEAYEKELTDLFMRNYEGINTQVLLALGIVTQEQLDKIERDSEQKDFLDSFLQAKLKEAEKEEKLR